MKTLADIKKVLSEDRPAAWNALPDIDLYMDQVLGYMRRQLFSSRPESSVTAAMVNNYIRDGILPRTNGKKYSREHLAKLTTICIMKQVLSVGDFPLLFTLFSKEDLPEAYDKYREVLNAELTAVTEKVPTEDDKRIIADAIIHFSLISYANMVAAEQLIDMVRQQNDAEKAKK